MSDLAKVLGPLEARVLETVWAAGGPVSVRQVLERVNEKADAPLAYTTVMTVMARLAEKEILRRRLQGRGYVYEAVVTDAASIAVRGVIRDFGDAALSHFMDEASTDPRLMRRLEALLGERREA